MKGCRGLISLTLLVCTFFSIVLGMPEPNDEISSFMRNAMKSGGNFSTLTAQQVREMVRGLVPTVRKFTPILREYTPLLRELTPILGEWSDELYFETAQYTQMGTLLVIVSGILVVLTGIGCCACVAILNKRWYVPLSNHKKFATTASINHIAPRISEDEFLRITKWTKYLWCGGIQTSLPPSFDAI